MSTARKLILSWLLLAGSVLLLQVNGWFAVGFLVALPFVILLWFDLGRELRTSPRSSRATVVIGLLMGLPQAVFGLLSTMIGIAIVLWVLYNSLWTRDPNYTGGFLTFGIGPALVLFGAGLMIDAFKRSRCE